MDRQTEGTEGLQDFSQSARVLVLAQEYLDQKLARMA